DAGGYCYNYNVGEGGYCLNDLSYTHNEWLNENEDNYIEDGYCYTATPAPSVSCVPSKLYVSVGESVTWTASASGGNGSYSYSWSGSTSPLSGSGNPKTVSYNSTGLKYGRVNVTSD